MYASPFPTSKSATTQKHKILGTERAHHPPLNFKRPKTPKPKRQIRHDKTEHPKPEAVLGSPGIEVEALFDIRAKRHTIVGLYTRAVQHHVMLVKLQG